MVCIYFNWFFFFSTTVQSATRSAVNFTLLFGALFQQHPFNFSNQTKYKTDKRNSQRTHFIQSVHARRWKITHIFFFLHCYILTAICLLVTFSAYPRQGRCESIVIGQQRFLKEFISIMWKNQCYECKTTCFSFKLFYQMDGVDEKLATEKRTEWFAAV